MSTQLQIDKDVDALVDIVCEDAGIDRGSDICDITHDLAFSISQLSTELGATAFVETTDDEVIVTIRIPRV